MAPCRTSAQCSSAHSYRWMVALKVVGDRTMASRIHKLITIEEAYLCEHYASSSNRSETFPVVFEISSSLDS